MNVLAINIHVCVSLAVLLLVTGEAAEARPDTRTPLSLAADALRRGHYQTAVRQATKGLDDANADQACTARLIIADAYLAMGEPDEATKLIPPMDIPVFELGNLP